MDINIRNNAMENYEYLIKAVIYQNKRLLKALHVDMDDAYQELVISLFNAIDKYDPQRASSIVNYICIKLRNTIIDLTSNHKSHGMTGTNGKYISFVSIEHFCNSGESLDIPYEDDVSLINLSDIFEMLPSCERKALDMRMDGRRLRKKRQRDSF